MRSLRMTSVSLVAAVLTLAMAPPAANATAPPDEPQAPAISMYNNLLTSANAGLVDTSGFPLTERGSLNLGVASIGNVDVGLTFTSNPPTTSDVPLRPEVRCSRSSNESVYTYFDHVRRDPDRGNDEHALMKKRLDYARQPGFGSVNGAHGRISELV